MTVDNIADRLLKLDEKSRSDIFNDFSIKLESNEISRKELSEKIINKFDKNKQLLEKLELNIVYFELFPELNSIPKDVLKNFFPRRLRNKITSKMNKNDILQFLKESMVSKSIDIQKVNSKISIYSVISKVRTINDKDELTSLSIFLWGEIIEELDKDQIIKKLSTDLEFDMLSPENIEIYLNDKNINTKNTSKKANSLKFDDLITEIKTLKIQVLSLESKIKNQEQKLIELNNNLVHKISILESNVNSLVSRLNEFEKK